MNTTSQAKSYFDLHTSGMGYLQRVREVPVKGGRRAEPFLACTLAALTGSANEPLLRYFDVNVSGKEARELVSRYLGVDDPKQRPLVRFRIGDLWSDAYLRPSGAHKGEAAASLKGRLLKTELIDRAEQGRNEPHELITRGIGYLKRPREVTRKDGDPFLSCTIGALTGPVEDPEYRYIETVVTTTEAQHLVRRCVQAIETNKKVLIAFTLNDIQADAYLRTRGEHAGEAGASLKSTLTGIRLIKINGRKVYPQATANAAQPASSEAGVTDGMAQEQALTL